MNRYATSPHGDQSRKGESVIKHGRVLRSFKKPCRDIIDI